MSLGLPEFGSRGSADPTAAFWRVVQVSGYVALSYALGLAGTEWWSARSAELALERARAAVTEATRSVEETRRSLQTNGDLLVAVASVESSPDHVLSDLDALLPDGVSLTSLKLEYLPDATTRVDLSVVAATPHAYDRFLSALSKSPAFSDIKPGSESRPGLVKATVNAIHRPRGGVR
ncbi:MAG: PilN domain-containing protein [Vicinamibacteria bacterium]|nr:PilN domain-containing protein [Vicinamibacteria bacterium]